MAKPTIASLQKQLDAAERRIAELEARVALAAECFVEQRTRLRAMHVRKQPVPVPKVTTFTDRHGVQWEKTAFPNGKAVSRKVEEVSEIADYDDSF